jgi:acetyltransferase-like isoleucine patch superfamily enzyme
MLTSTLPSIRPNPLLSLLIWLLPSCAFKIWALRRLGHSIGASVTIGPILVLGCGRFSLDDGASISPFNAFRKLANVKLGKNCFIGSWNQITAADGYQKYSTLVGLLLLEDQAVIMNRHYLDCSGQIILRRFSAIGGIKSIFQSHELDLAEDNTTIGRIILGEKSMTGTAVIMLKDAYLPERSVLAAGSLAVKPREGVELPTASLYGGIPAKPIRQLDDIAWWHRDSYATLVSPFDDEMFRLD